MSVDAVQLRLIWDVETAVAERPVGTDGAVVSGLPLIRFRVVVLETPPSVAVTVAL